MYADQALSQGVDPILSQLVRCSMYVGSGARVLASRLLLFCSVPLRCDVWVYAQELEMT